MRLGEGSERIRRVQGTFFFFFFAFSSISSAQVVMHQRRSSGLVPHIWPIPGFLPKLDWRAASFAESSSRRRH